jgi:uncharacterized membrane protein YqjE
MTTTDTDYQLPTLGRLARRTAGTFIGALENRAELFTVEFQEENDRLLKMIIFGVGGVFLAMIAVLLITGTIIFLVPEPYRVYAAGGFAALYMAGTVAAVLTIKKLIKIPPFAESLKQIKKDSELLEAFK